MSESFFDHTGILNSRLRKKSYEKNIELWSHSAIIMVIIISSPFAIIIVVIIIISHPVAKC